jgi:hypothetical protein
MSHRFLVMVLERSKRRTVYLGGALPRGRRLLIAGVQNVDRA